jgi:hypothetical protein
VDITKEIVLKEGKRAAISEGVTTEGEIPERATKNPENIRKRCHSIDTFLHFLHPILIIGFHYSFNFIDKI